MLHLDNNTQLYILNTKDKVSLSYDLVYMKKLYIDNKRPKPSWRISASTENLFEEFKDLEENRLYMLGRFMYDNWKNSEIYESFNEAMDFCTAVKREFSIKKMERPTIIDARKYSFY